MEKIIALKVDWRTRAISVVGTTAGKSLSIRALGALVARSTSTVGYYPIVFSETSQTMASVDEIKKNVREGVWQIR